MCDLCHCDMTLCVCVCRRISQKYRVRKFEFCHFVILDNFVTQTRIRIMKINVVRHVSRAIQQMLKHRSFYNVKIIMKKQIGKYTRNEDIALYEIRQGLLKSL